MTTVAEIVWGITSRPCSNRRTRPDTLVGEDCERRDCTEYVTSDDRREYSLEDLGEPTVDDILAWLKAQDRHVKIGGGTSGHQWQVRVTLPGLYQEHVLFSRSANAPTLLAALQDIVLRVHAGSIP